MGFIEKLFEDSRPEVKTNQIFFSFATENNPKEQRGVEKTK